MTDATEAYDDSAAAQTCLAAEHAAVYAYGVVGGRLTGLAPTGDDAARAAAGYEWHRAQRDALDQLVRDLGSDPVAAEPAYSLPVTPENVAQCRRLARYLENRCAEAYAYALSLSSSATRVLLANGLGETAVRAHAWGARLTAFPGRPDL
jgi:hypothetical protein